jgi:hypothetical protein
LDGWPLLPCADEEVEVVPPDGTLQLLQDGRGVVVGALDEVGLAVAPEADGTRPGRRSELPSGHLEAWGGLEAEASRVGNGAEHQVTAQLHWRCQRLGLVGGEIRAGELGHAALVHDARADDVLDPRHQTSTSQPQTRTRP